jgi:signal transduction histidine kinase
VAVVLLAAHNVSGYDPLLIIATLAWTSISIGAYARSAKLQNSPVAWVVDTGVALLLVYLSTDWRSPFYIFALTSLILPATALPFRRALGYGLGLHDRLPRRGDPHRAAGRGDVRARDPAGDHHDAPHGPDRRRARAGYASELLFRLREERSKAERLAVQAERQRIAWELHDSAKQRVHAAHLVLSALDARSDGTDEIVEHVLAELRAATADMDTSVAELSAPLDGRPVDLLLRERARELEPASPRSSRSTAACPTCRRSSPRTPTASPPRRSPTPCATAAPRGSTSSSAPTARRCGSSCATTARACPTRPGRARTGCHRCATAPRRSAPS